MNWKNLRLNLLIGLCVTGALALALPKETYLRFFIGWTIAGFALNIRWGSRGRSLTDNFTDRD